MHGDPAPVPPFPAPPRVGRRARARLAALVAAALLVPGAAAARGDLPVVEVPPAACDVCAPGKPPPPAAVQDQVRRLNERANWRRQTTSGDTIPLGSATRIWLQRAWASGRLQPGVANTGSSLGVGGGAAGLRTGLRRPARTSLASRSRASLADRRSTRDQGRRGRSQRGAEDSSMSSAGSSFGSESSFGRSSFGSGSALGTNRSSSAFGSSRRTSSRMAE